MNKASLLFTLSILLHLSSSNTAFSASSFETESLTAPTQKQQAVISSAIITPNDLYETFVPLPEIKEDYNKALDLFKKNDFSAAFSAFKKLEFSGRGAVLYMMGACGENLGYIKEATDYYLIAAYMEKIQQGHITKNTLNKLGEGHPCLKSLNDFLSFQEMNAIPVFIKYLYPLAKAWNTQALNTIGACYAFMLEKSYANLKQNKQSSKGYSHLREQAICYYETAASWYLFSLPLTVAGQKNDYKLIIEAEKNLQKEIKTNLLDKNYALIEKDTKSYRKNFKIHNKIFSKSFAKNTPVFPEEKIFNYYESIGYAYYKDSYEDYLPHLSLLYKNLYFLDKLILIANKNSLFVRNETTQKLKNLTETLKIEIAFALALQLNELSENESELDGGIRGNSLKEVYYAKMINYVKNSGECNSVYNPYFEAIGFITGCTIAPQVDTKEKRATHIISLLKEQINVHKNLSSQSKFFTLPFMQLNLGQSYRILGKYNIAKKYLEEAYATFPKARVHLYQILALEESNVESQKKAYTIVCDLLKTDPSSFFFLYSAGHLLQSNNFFGDPDQYLEKTYNYYTKACDYCGEQTNEIETVKENMATLLFNKPSLSNFNQDNRHQRIRDILKDINTPEALYIRGRSKLEEKKFEDALQLFIDSGTENAKFHIGKLYLDKSVAKDLPEQERLSIAYNFLRNSSLDVAKFSLALHYINDLEDNLKENAQQIIEILEPLVLKGYEEANTLLNSFYKAMFYKDSLEKEQNKKILQETEPTDKIVILTEKNLTVFEDTQEKK